MMQCVLHLAELAAQASIAKKVDHHPPPQPEDVAHHLTHTVLPLPQAGAMCSPLAPGYCYADHPQEEQHHHQARGGAGPRSDSAEQTDQLANPTLPAADADHNIDRRTRRAVGVFFSPFISGLSPEGVSPQLLPSYPALHPPVFPVPHQEPQHPGCCIHPGRVMHAAG